MAWSEQQGLVGAILALSLTLLLTTLHFRRRASAKKPIAAEPPLPPGPRGLPLLGYLPFLGTDLHREFTKLASLYGPIFKLYLGNKLCVVINSPELVKEVVRDKDTVFANHEVSAAAAVALFGGNDIVFTPYGDEWKKLRKVFVREMMSNAVLDSLYSLRREALRRSIQRIYKSAGEPLDVASLAFFTIANATMSMLCCGKLQGEEKAIVGGGSGAADEFRHVAAELMVLLGKPNVSDVYPALAWLDVQGIERDTKRVSRVFEAMFDAAIERRKRAMAAGERDGVDGKGSERKDFLQVLLEMHESEDSAESITTSQLKAMLMDIVVGGTDTTVTAVEWTMAELVKHPKVMNKVLEELRHVVGLKNLVEESHLSQLTYLNAVIKETLRLHPPLPLLVPRYPSQSTTIGGYSVPKGTKIFMNIGAIHSNPNYWEDPSEFRPDRFLNVHISDAEKYDLSGNNFTFVPLGSGRRVCAGIPLVERMLYYVVASLLHSFEWKLPSGAKLELSDRFGIVVKKREPLVLIPTSRLSHLELYA